MYSSLKMALSNHILITKQTTNSAKVHDSGLDSKIGDLRDAIISFNFQILYNFWVQQQKGSLVL